MRVSSHNCIFYTKYEKCNHLDARSLFWTRECVLLDEFVLECSKRIKHEKANFPPPPPLKR